MERVLEPEVMDGMEQSAAYAQADFEAVDRAFVARFIDAFPAFTAGRVLDLGCGPAAISRYLCEALPNIRVTGADAAQSMIEMAAQGRARAGLEDRIELVCGYFPGAVGSEQRFDAAISNSLLHHLPDPSVLWSEIARLAKPGSPVMVIDLTRPESTDGAHRIVETYSADEPEILKVDFFNSLCAAFTLNEITSQLAAAGLSHLSAQAISDRHVAVWGPL
jgi:ubiquinone/menaquinone biosynthesis C-methylase UbiE